MSAIFALPVLHMYILEHLFLTDHLIDRYFSEVLLSIRLLARGA